MSKPLPIGGFKWMGESEIASKFNTDDYQKNVMAILELNDDSNTGYLFEVDLHYPSELHDCHNDYPFCPEKRSIPGVSQEKLMLTFYDKEKYVVHYSMLKLALEHNLILKKVHRVLQFEQSTWLKPYIELNTRYRMSATTNFEKDFYKLLNNAIYGKTMENLRLRSEIRLVNKWDGRGPYNARSMIARPNFKKSTVFDEDLVAIELHKTHIKMTKPLIVGMCVLDLSKILMYEFFYKYLKPKYGENIRLLYTDTDSLILEIKTENVYEDIRDDKHNMFDTSGYASDNSYGIVKKNNKVPGKFSDELKGKIINKGVFVGPKCYTLGIKIDDECDEEERKKKSVVKRAKGVKNSTLENQITIDDFQDCVMNNSIKSREQFTIRSKKHELYTISMKKIALNPFNDKRYIIRPDCIDTLAWGHYSLDTEKMNEECQYAIDVKRQLRDFLKSSK